MPNNTAATTIKTYIDSLEESWKRSSFVDRLDSIRSIADSEGYPDGIAESVIEFMGLEPTERQSLIQMLRIRNQVLDWAREAGDSEAVSALADDLMALVEQAAE